MPVWLPLLMALGVWRGRSFVVLRLLVFLWVYLSLVRVRPEIAAIGASMTHVLPPRLVGPLATLDAAPTADCLIISHRGLEGFATPRGFLMGNAVGRELRVGVRRIARQSVSSPPEQLRWLFEQRKEVDDFAAGRSSVRPSRPCCRLASGSASLEFSAGPRFQPTRRC